MSPRARTVTILFTDLVGSTELLQRAGDELAERIFKAHHRLLREAVEAHGGQEVKWLGDGLMVAFDSTAEAVKCAIAMQQASRRPTAGERLEIRAGLNVGEAFVDETSADLDYFGSSVVIARRLCDSGGKGQILASDIVVRLLDGRGDGLQTRDLGPLDLKGIANPVAAVEIIYEHDPMALLRRLPFVGRDAEYATMLKKLEEANKGRGSVLLLAGEPGIGKTRLTEEICEHAASLATVIRGNCYEGDVAAPFGPWMEALRSLIEQTPDDKLSETLGAGAPDIAAMLPELRRRIPHIEEAARLEPEAERARLFESINAWFRNAAEHRPLVIFHDDLHWCDRPSLALLEQVARNIANQRIVIIGTYRDVEVDRVHPLAQTLAALRRMEHHERIGLRGFTEASVLDLLAAVEPAESAAPAREVLAHALHDGCEGNPFFIREVLNNLVETGKLVQQDGVWVETVASVEELGIPEGIKELIGRRLTRLSETCNRMLQRASAMTGGFTWDELRSICDDGEDDLLDALDEALGSQLVEERERNTYTFTHALIRATLYDELSTPRRVQLHRRIGESLESLYATDIDEHLGELAAHYLASTGNAAEKAVEYSIRAGDRSLERYAWEDAALHFERALAAMDFSRSSDDELRCNVLLALADAERQCGAMGPSLDHTRAAAEHARRSHNPSLMARSALEFRTTAYHIDDVELQRESVKLIDEALETQGGDGSAEHAHLLIGRATASATVASGSAGGTAAGGAGLVFGPRIPNVIADAREAYAIAEACGDDDAIRGATELLHQLLWSPDNVLERLELLERSRVPAERLGLWARWLWLSDLAVDQLELGDIVGVEQSISELQQGAEQSRVRADAYFVPSLRVTLLTARGELAAAEQVRDDYVSSSSTVDAAATIVAQVTALRLLQGRLIELEPLWRDVVQQSPGVPAYRAVLAVAYADAGRTDEAQDEVDRLNAMAPAEVPRDGLWKALRYQQSDACAEIGDQRTAAQLYSELLPYTSSNATVVQAISYGSMARVVGRLATILERFDEAEEHFETALAANDKMAFHAWTTWTRLNYGDMLVRRNGAGDREQAVGLLRQAHDFAKESGMGKVERDSERLLASLT